MYKLSGETRKNINDIIQGALGISYCEFEQLDSKEQQKLIKEYHEKHPLRKSDEVRVMIGSGESSLFITAKRGERVLIGEGENSCFVRVGVTPEEERQEVDDYFDNILHSKPGAFVRKMQRVLKK